MKRISTKAITSAGMVLVLLLLLVGSVGCGSEEAAAHEVILASTEPAAAKSVETGATTEETPVPTEQATATTEAEPSGGLAPAAAASAPERSLTVDVVVYATQTSGLAAVRELTLAAPHLQVALVSCGNLLETPLAQGLSVEDARDIGRIKGGFYDEWRKTVIDMYAAKGIKPYTRSGRFVYEPEAAAEALWKLAKGPEFGETLFFSASLLGASDKGSERWVDLHVEGEGPLRIHTTYFIDASVEAELARALGADYRMGRHEVVYNDARGMRPAPPSAENDFVTAPQRFSSLLTLRVHSGRAPRIAALDHMNYDPASYASLPPLAQKNVTAFKDSWSMNIAVLPNGKRELNETWSDWPDVGLSFQWIFAPDKRGEIRKRVLEWSLNRVRYLQENGYPHIGIAAIPQKLYVREGPRVVGLDTYTKDDLQSAAERDTVAIGCYVEYDRHDAFYPNHSDHTRVAYVPMKALMAKDHPWLLVSTGISTDYYAYSSAVRMEHTRASMGGAAGAIVAAADKMGTSPDSVPYAAVKDLLVKTGYRLALAP